MLQDIAPHVFDNAYDKKRPAAAGDRILCFHKDEILIRETEESAGGYEFIRFEELDPKLRRQERLTYLFSIDETAYYLLPHEVLLEAREQDEGGACHGGAADWGPSDSWAAESGLHDSGAAESGLRDSWAARCGASFQPVQIFRAMPDGDSSALALMTGLHLYTWMRKNRYCGCCGSETQPHARERALFCPQCKNLIFPQIAPAVAVAVTDGDRILLARSSQGAFRRFSLIAGYVEVGESVEETVRREVMEEVGLQVKNLQYFKSQPWGLTGIEMLGYFAELSGSDAVKLQETELAEARWFHAEEVDRDMSFHSLSYTMIDEFCRRKLGR